MPSPRFPRGLYNLAIHSSSTMTEKRPTGVSKPWYTKLKPSICTPTSGIDQHHSSPSTRRSVSSDTSLPPYSSSTSSPFPKSRQGSRTIFGFAERACTAKVELYRSVIPLKDIQLASIAETARLLTRIEVFLAEPSVSMSMSMSFSMTPAPLIMDRIAMHGQIVSVILQGLERLPVSDARGNHAAMRGFEGQLSALVRIARTGRAAAMADHTSPGLKRLMDRKASSTSTCSSLSNIHSYAR